ncbi:MAG TPA: hypothetical protein VNS55_06190 [Nocardioides sp.]|nr:hypothetical protein [Nocardioides sp.]
MVLFGLVLLILGVLLLLAGVFTAGFDYDQGSTHNELLNLNMSPPVLFMFGVAAGALVIAGIWFLKFGAQLGWKRRKEQRRLTELSEKLDRVEAERHAALEEGNDG